MGSCRGGCGLGGRCLLCVRGLLLWNGWVTKSRRKGRIMHGLHSHSSHLSALASPPHTPWRHSSAPYPPNARGLGPSVDEPDPVQHFCMTHPVKQDLQGGQTGRSNRRRRQRGNGVNADAAGEYRAACRWQPPTPPCSHHAGIVGQACNTAAMQAVCDASIPPNGGPHKPMHPPGRSLWF